MVQFKGNTKLNFIAFSFYCSLFLISCNDKLEKLPIISTYNNRKIGDSIIINNKLHKITFRKYSSKDVDSIVYFRNIITSLLADQKSYLGHKQVFESISYNVFNGRIKSYQFLSPFVDSCIYIRKYDEKGFPILDSGNLFFLVNQDKINTHTLEVKDDGTRMHIWIYYPNPPDVKVFLYVLKDGIKHDVFKNNEAIPYLKETWVDTKKSNKEFSVINIGMDFIDHTGDTLNVNELLYFKIVKD